MTSSSDTAPVHPEVSSEEVDELLGVQAAAEAGVSVYALGAPEKLVSGRMPAFDRLNERWVKEFARELAERLRKPLEATVREVQLMPYADWQASVPPPGSLHVYAVRPWARSAVIAVDGELTFVLVDGYFGGAGSTDPAPAARGSLTRTEQRLAKIIVELFVKLFQPAFMPIAELELTPVGTEENAQYVSIAQAAETVAVARVDVSLNGQAGAVSLVVPLACLEPLREKLVEGPRNAGGEALESWREALAEHLAHTEVELATVLLETRLSVRELLQLQSGDILPVDMPSTATLYAGTLPLLRGRFGVSHGSNAVIVTEAINTAPANGAERRR